MQPDDYTREIREWGRVELETKKERKIYWHNQKAEILENATDANEVCNAYNNYDELIISDNY